MTFTGKLYPFQEEAKERMIERRKLLLSLSMGLGKTVVTIAAIEELLDNGLVETGLVVVPASLKYQWARMIQQFTDDDAWVIVMDGAPRQREMLYSEAMTGEYEYIILNYEQVVRDWDFVRQLPRDFVVADECVAIKNPQSKRSKRTKRLQAPYLYGLSGQPIENRPEEVFSIMQWIDDTVLGRADTFDATFVVRDYFGSVKYYRNIPTLHRKLSEAMVRKSREEVADQLPKVVDNPPLEVLFDSAGRKLYQYIARDLQADLAEAVGFMGTFDVFRHYSGISADEAAMRGRIMSKLTCLRLLCDHPELLKISAARYQAVEQGEPGVSGGSAYAAELKEAGLLNGLDVAPKFDAALELIMEMIDADPANKVVLFSFFVPTLGILQDALGARGIKAVQFTGEMNARQKDQAKQQFQTDPAVRVFLSSDAGGYGVDLPEANFLCNYNLPWSAGKLDQRNARIIRLSSEWETVWIHTLVMRGSIEVRMHEALAAKSKIATAIMDGQGHDTKGRLVLDLRTLTQFLGDSDV